MYTGATRRRSFLASLPLWNARRRRRQLSNVDACGAKGVCRPPNKFAAARPNAGAAEVRQFTILMGRAGQVDARPLNCGGMRNGTPQLWFKSDLFTVDPREDEETNPFCYGKQLAAWIAKRFRASGYEPEPVIAEDWGWCVMLERKPFMLWVGCGNIRSEFYESVSPEEKPSFVPQPDQLTWTCFVGSDVPIWASFYWRRLVGKGSTSDSVARVARQLEEFLRAEPRISLTKEP